MESTDNEVTTPLATQAVPKTSIDPAQLAAMAAAHRIEMHSRIMRVFASQIDTNCFDDIGGHVRFNWRACRKAINVFGINLTIDALEPWREKDEDGEYTIYRHKAVASATAPDGKTVSVEGLGYFSTRDKFFGRQDGKSKPLKDVDTEQVLRASATEAKKKAVFDLIGLGEPTKEELSAIGVGVDVINTVKFKTAGGSHGLPPAQAVAGQQEPPPVTASPEDTGEFINTKQAGLVYAKWKESGLTEDDFRAWLKENCGVTSRAKRFTPYIKRDDMDTVLAYLNENAEAKKDRELFE